MLRYLVLFDVDGTLVWPDGLGKATLRLALERVFGTQGRLATYGLAGQTDRQIVREVLPRDAFSDEEIDAHFDALGDAMVEVMQERLSLHDLRPRTGATALVERLRARQDVLLGLVTGNFRETGLLKLSAAGYRTEDFRVGAYGSERAARNDLPPLAVERALQLTGHRFEGRDVAVVGDTPADIACARAVGGHAVAVATGDESLETLRAHAPDVLLPNFHDTSQALAAILGPDAASSSA